jgi:hypothetical protein
LYGNPGQQEPQVLSLLALLVQKYKILTPEEPQGVTNAARKERKKLVQQLCRQAL